MPNIWYGDDTIIETSGIVANKTFRRIMCHEHKTSESTNGYNAVMGYIEYSSDRLSKVTYNVVPNKPLNWSKKEKKEELR